MMRFVFGLVMLTVPVAGWAGGAQRTKASPEYLDQRADAMLGVAKELRHRAADVLAGARQPESRADAYMYPRTSPEGQAYEAELGSGMRLALRAQVYEGRSLVYQLIAQRRRTRAIEELHGRGASNALALSEREASRLADALKGHQSSLRDWTVALRWVELTMERQRRGEGDTARAERRVLAALYPPTERQGTTCRGSLADPPKRYRFDPRVEALSGLYGVTSGKPPTGNNWYTLRRLVQTPHVAGTGRR